MLENTGLLTRPHAVGRRRPTLHADAAAGFALAFAGAGALFFADSWVSYTAVLLLVGGAVAIGWRSRPDWRLREQAVAHSATAPEPKPSLLEMVELAGGKFVMGSPEEEPGRHPDEGPQHVVHLTPFAIGKFTVTRAEYRRVAKYAAESGHGPVLDVPGEWTDHDDGTLPANYTSWFDAVRFSNALSLMEGRTPCYDIAGDPNTPVVRWTDSASDGYRLPTEAEWEYAARAGTQTAYFFGKDEAGLAQYAWSDRAVHRVGQKAASPWGLHDVYGNVWEWCWDWFDSAYYRVYGVVDPRGPLRGERVRSLRGGSSWDVPSVLRSAFRNGNGPEVRVEVFGFRCVRAARRQP